MIPWMTSDPIGNWFPFGSHVKAIAAMGGTAGQLSNGLWQARGDEFSVEKADFGYMARGHSKQAGTDEPHRSVTRKKQWNDLWPQQKHFEWPRIWWMDVYDITYLYLFNLFMLFGPAMAHNVPILIWRCSSIRSQCWSLSASNRSKIGRLRSAALTSLGSFRSLRSTVCLSGHLHFFDSHCRITLVVWSSCGWVDADDHFAISGLYG